MEKNTKVKTATITGFEKLVCMCGEYKCDCGRKFSLPHGGGPPAYCPSCGRRTKKK